MTTYMSQMQEVIARLCLLSAAERKADRNFSTATISLPTMQKIVLIVGFFGGRGWFVCF